MKQNVPALIVAALSGLVASLVGGFLIASWTIAGVAPATAAPALPKRATAHVVSPTDRWREAGYEKIGLWDRERDAMDTYASGSSRL